MDPKYRWQLIDAQVTGRAVRIPSRLHFNGFALPDSSENTAELMVVDCLCTRSTDGYLRHAALRKIVYSADPAALPYVALLAGEYVVEITQDIVLAMPDMDRDAYVNFVRENRPLMTNLRAKATSYWNEYYRRQYPVRTEYPGLAFLHEIERWAG